MPKLVHMKIVFRRKKREMTNLNAWDNNIRRWFTIAETADLIPRGTAGIDNYSTYGFSLTSLSTYLQELYY